jgi:hypothetical protein
MDGGNYERILQEPWPQTRKTLSGEEIADYRAEAKAMISGVLATDVPGSLICPPDVKHPIRAMDGHFDDCLFSDFQWEGDVLSCRPLYWYVERVSSRKAFRHGHLDSVVKVDFRRSPEAVIYSDRFVEIKVSEEWYPYNGVLRIPTPNAEAAGRLLDAFEVMGAVPVERWPLRWGAAAQGTSVPLPQGPGPSRDSRMALERIYMALRKGPISRKGRTVSTLSAKTVRFQDDYTLVLGGVTAKEEKTEDEGRARPGTRERVLTAHEAYVRVAGGHISVYMTDPEFRSQNRIYREKSQWIYLPLLIPRRDEHAAEGGE